MTAPRSPLAPYDPSFAAALPARRRRVPLWARVLLTLTAVAALAATVFVAAVVISFSGGLDDALDVRKPTETSRSVVAAREDAEQGAGPLHAEVTRGLAGDTRIRVAKDECDEGQHNFKVDDSYDLDCVLSRGSVFVADGAAEVNRVATEVGARLEGWTPQEPTYSGTQRWTRGGPADGTAGVQEVTLAVVSPARLLPSDIGGGYSTAAEGSGITRDGRPFSLKDLRVGPLGQLVVVTTSERYFYD